MGKSNKTTYILILILVLAGGYWGYQQYSNSGSVETAGVTVTNEVGAPIGEPTSQADQFLAILQNIDQVTLQEKSLLSDPLFASKLQDFGKVVEDRPLGRSNPFAALTGGPAVVVKPTTKSAPVAPAAEEETVVPPEAMGE